MSLVFKFFIIFIGHALCVGDYTPDWNSIDSRPLPNWYDDSKLGIFAHWGVYSVPAYNSEWFWFYWKKNDDPRFQHFVDSHFINGTTYADFAKEFTAEDFDADKFAETIKSSGARYFVLTSKHHEGFTLWPSSTSWNWNSVDVGPHRDLVGELSKSIRKSGLHFGTYFSLMDWYHPLYVADGKHQNTSNYVAAVSLPQLHELVENYQPDVIWTDGDWDRSEKYWQSKEFLAWLYNYSPIRDKVVVNDRWGSGTAGNHGGFLTHNDEFDPGVLLSRKWENCLKLDQHSWGFRRNIKPWDVLSVKTLIVKLARTISCGGNLLLNFGPDRTGRVIPIFEERLRKFGSFVSNNNKAIFGTKPWIYQNESNSIWYTSRLRNNNVFNINRIFNQQNIDETIIYAFIVDIPKDGLIILKSIKLTPKTKVLLLGTNLELIPQKLFSPALVVDLNQVSWQKWPSLIALVLQIEYAATEKRDPLFINQPFENSLKQSFPSNKFHIASSSSSSSK